jgi:hypothetical protein
MARQQKRVLPTWVWVLFLVLSALLTGVVGAVFVAGAASHAIQREPALDPYEYGPHEGLS